MTANDIDGDFTVVDTATLNRYFRDYYRPRTCTAATTEDP
jgi:hypothetical protein